MSSPVSTPFQDESNSQVDLARILGSVQSPVAQSDDEAVDVPWPLRKPLFQDLEAIKPYLTCAVLVAGGVAKLHLVR